jgi:hypothetical protein
MGSIAPVQPDVRAKIKSILCRLEILHEQIWLVEHVVEELCLRGTILAKSGGDGRALPKFSSASAATVERQLTEFQLRTANLAEKIEKGGRSVRAREQLARLVDSLSATSIFAMADAKLDGCYILPDVSQLTTGTLSARLLGRRDDSFQHPDVPAPELRFWSAVAAKAYAVAKKNTGHPPNMQVHNIAELIVRSYERLTGREPTFSSTTRRRVSQKLSYAGSTRRPPLPRKRKNAGRIPSLCTRHINALGIGIDAISYIAPAAFKRRGKGRRR